LKPQHEEPLSTLAFKFKVRRYNQVSDKGSMMRSRQVPKP
jgi:hypothetical protein